MSGERGGGGGKRENRELVGRVNVGQWLNNGYQKSLVRFHFVIVDKQHSLFVPNPTPQPLVTALTIRLLLNTNVNGRLCRAIKKR